MPIFWSEIAYSLRDFPRKLWVPRPWSEQSLWNLVSCPKYASKEKFKEWKSFHRGFCVLYLDFLLSQCFFEIIEWHENISFYHVKVTFFQKLSCMRALESWIRPEQMYKCNLELYMWSYQVSCQEAQHSLWYILIEICGYFWILVPYSYAFLTENKNIDKKML